MSGTIGAMQNSLLAGQGITGGILSSIDPVLGKIWGYATDLAAPFAMMGVGGGGAGGLSAAPGLASLFGGTMSGAPAASAAGTAATAPGTLAGATAAAPSLTSGGLGLMGGPASTAFGANIDPSIAGGLGIDPSINPAQFPTPAAAPTTPMSIGGTNPQPSPLGASASNVGRAYLDYITQMRLQQLRNQTAYASPHSTPPSQMPGLNLIQPGQFALPQL